MTFRYTCGKLYSIKDYGSGKWSEVQVVVAPNVQITLTRFSSPLEAERRKKLQYKMNRVSIDAECRRINADKEYKRKIAQALEEGGFGNQVGIVVRKREDIHVETCNW